MNLVVDIGNTSIKFAFFEGDNLVDTGVSSPTTLSPMLERIATVEPEAALVSAVSGIPSELQEMLNRLPRCIYLTAEVPVPLVNEYATPASLGMDRLANAVAAAALYPFDNVVVVDAGTCLKFDLVRAGKHYAGGSIAPGLFMRYKALHHFTDKLPELAPLEQEPALVGTDTLSSIHAGVIRGMEAEIIALIDQYNMEVPNIQWILTGGDARFFPNLLKNGIFALPQLTLTGLHIILRYNQ